MWGFLLVETRDGTVTGRLYGELTCGYHRGASCRQCQHASLPKIERTIIGRPVPSSTIATRQPNIGLLPNPQEKATACLALATAEVR